MSGEVHCPQRESQGLPACTHRMTGMQPLARELAVTIVQGYAAAQRGHHDDQLL